MAQLILLPETRTFRDDLETFKLFLEQPDIRWRKLEMLERASQDPKLRKLAIDQLRGGLGIFSRSARSMIDYRSDPCFLDRCCLDLKHTCALISVVDWPELHQIAASFLELERETREARLALLLKPVANSNYLD